MSNTDLNMLISQKRDELRILEEAKERIRSLERLKAREQKISPRITLQDDDVPF